MNKKLKIAKTIVCIGAGIGASAIVNSIVKSNAPSTTNIIVKACVVLGGMALAGLAGKAADKEMGKQFDNVVEIYEDVKNKISSELNSQEVSA